MMGALFVRECRQILKSLIYYIYLLVFVVFLTSQMSDSDWMNDLIEPEPGWDNYGYGSSTDEADIMENGIENLFEETYGNSFYTYPFGFVKVVTLDDEGISELKTALEEATGKTFGELEELHHAYWSSVTSYDSYEEYRKAENGWHIPIRENYTYEQFEKLMNRAAELIGKGSYYESDYLHGAIVELTYEQAHRNWQELCEKDRVTGAALRLFCDYAGFILALLTIFIGTAAGLRDKRARVSEVLYAKPVSGAVLLVSRYLANVVMLFVPVVVYGFLLQLPYQYQTLKMGMSPDGLAFLKYNLLWNLPIIMAMLALSFFLTEVAQNILAIPVGLVWVFGSEITADTLTGNFGLKLVTRWNRFGGYNSFAAQFAELCRNKIYYVGLSIVLLLLTIIVYEKRRREGTSLYGKIFKNRA